MKISKNSITTDLEKCNVVEKFFLKKIYLSNFQIGLYIAIFITLFPFSPTGNFFNNYISIIHFIPLGFLIYSYKKDTVFN